MLLQQLFLFLIALQFCASSHSTNQTEESYTSGIVQFINTKLVACSEQSEDEDQRSEGCQRLTNMNVQNNSSLNCLDPFLKITFKIFQKWIIADDSGDSEIKNHNYTEYETINSEGYLVETNNPLNLQANFVLLINHSIVKATQNCKKIRR